MMKKIEYQNKIQIKLQKKIESREKGRMKHENVKYFNEKQLLKRNI